jgi:phosphoglycerate dehydrogenase-like enzyme
MKVVIIEGQTSPLVNQANPDIEQVALGSSVDVQWYGVVDPRDYADVLGTADAVIARALTPLTAEMIQAMRNVQVIVIMGVGFDRVCREAAEAQDIVVCNVPDHGTEEVADATMAMLLAHQRQLLKFQERRYEMSAWDWRMYIPLTRSRQLRVGVIGLGRIGSAVALRLKPFGHAVTCFDPYLPRGVEKALGVDRVHTREELLATSDIVTVHTPLNDETQGMLDTAFFEQLKPHAIVLNTARGGLFASADVLYHALRERPGLRIGTDVWPQEPPEDHPLVSAWQEHDSWLGDRLIVTPHVAFYATASLEDMRRNAAALVKHMLDGGEPYNVVIGHRMQATPPPMSWSKADTHSKPAQAHQRRTSIGGGVTS